MRETQRTQEAGDGSAGQPAERELHIEISPDSCVRYEGTAAQLVAEGLIPDGFKWPTQPGSASMQWDANGFKYWLARKRPDGHKGPMRSWITMDNWSIRVLVKGRDSDWHQRRALERKAKELRAEYRALTAEGEREEYAKTKRYWAARDDKAFQAFKSRVPGLVPPKRGRKPKAANDGAQAA